MTAPMPPPPEEDHAVRVEAKARLQERIERERRAALVVNTRSRRGQRLYAKAKAALAAQGFTLDAAYPVRDPARLPEIVEQCVSAGHALVVVGGGDGTISAVVDSFAHRDVVFGLLPLGTANSFARSLGAPLDVEGAVEVIAGGKVVDIDLGMIDGDYFANAAAIGIQAAIARAVPHGLKKWLGRVGYLIVAAGMLTRLKSFRATLTTAGGAQVFEDALELRIANGRYKGGMLAADEAGLESRDLVVHVVRGRSVLRLAKVWAQIALRRRPSPDDVAVLHVTDFTLETEPRRYVSIDGEVVARTPMRVAVAKQALKIMAPRDFDPTPRAELS